MKESLGSWTGGEQLGGCGPGALTKERHGVGIAPESPNVSVHPAESHGDVLESVVTRRDVVSGAEETCGVYTNTIYIIP